MKRAAESVAGPVRTGIDSPWTLAVLCVAFVAIGTLLQQRVWTEIAADPRLPIFRAAPAAMACWVLAVAAVFLMARLAPETSRRLFGAIASGLGDERARPVLIGTVVLAAGAIAYAVLEVFPNSGDEYAYLFQAVQFAKGRLWADAPPLGYSFVPYRTWLADGKWVSQYPPGWPLVLAIPLLLHLPAWVSTPLLGGANVAALSARDWRFADRGTATIAIALYAMTPFFLFTAASFHSHMLTAFLIVLLCLCCHRYHRTGQRAPLIAAGALLGLIGMTRYFTLVLMAPALIYWIAVENRRERLRVLFLLALSGLPFLALLMGYQDLAIGDPLRSSYAVIAEKDTVLSIARSKVLLGALVTIVRLAELFIWASPILPLVYLVCLWTKLRSRSLAFYDLLFPSFVVGFVFFADLGGNRYGPRYYFEAFPLMMATIASALPQAFVWARRLMPRWPVLEATLMVGALYLATSWPAAIDAYHRQVEERQEPYRLVAAQGLSDAIVVIRDPSGPGLSAADLARNGDALDGSVLYARAKSRHNQPAATLAELQQAFPGRSIWIYRRDDVSEPGQLLPAVP